jgi:hypothetical protein
MSTLSAKYDPQAVPVNESGNMTEINQIVLYVGSGLLPQNLLRMSTQTSALRDAFVANIARTSMVEGALATFLGKLVTIENVMTAEEIAVCEYAATLAYMTNNIDLVKEILMRVPPKSVNSYLQTLYTAVAVRKWSSEIFNDALAEASTQSLYRWEAEKANVINI